MKPENFLNHLLSCAAESLPPMALSLICLTVCAPHRRFLLPLGALAGVMLTASHNPRTDNGFKFYWSDGGQVVPPVDQKFMELVKNVDEIKQMSFSEAVKSGMVKVIGSQVDEAYWSAVCGL